MPRRGPLCRFPQEECCLTTFVLSHLPLSWWRSLTRQTPLLNFLASSDAENLMCARQERLSAMQSRTCELRAHNSLVRSLASRTSTFGEEPGVSALDRSRTCNRQNRNLMHYPLCYERLYSGILTYL